MLNLTRCLTLYASALILLLQDQISYGAGSTRRDSNEVYCLELTGIIRALDDNCLNKATVNIYRDTTLFLSVKSRNTGKCSIKLPLNGKYTVVFSKPGYVSKKIVVNADIPFSRRQQYKLSFKIYLFEQVKGVDTSMFDAPVAFIIFKNAKNFDYDDSYTKVLNRKAEKIYKEYYSLEERPKSKTMVVTRSKF